MKLSNSFYKQKLSLNKTMAFAKTVKTFTCHICDGSSLILQSFNLQPLRMFSLRIHANIEKPGMLFQFFVVTVF